MQYNSNDLMPIAIAIIMFGIGLNLQFRDFRRVFIYPKAILIGLACQMLLLPALAFLLVWVWPMDPLYQVGIILIASAPGGTASNLVTNMLQGRVALSVSLTSFNSFLILFSIPALVGLSLEIFLGKHTTIELGFGDTFLQILFTVVLPVIAGVLVNEYGPQKWLARSRQPLRYILPGILLGVFALAFFSGEGHQGGALLDQWTLLIPLFVFNLLTMATGFYVARWSQLRHDGAFTIAVEMGLQNSALAIFIATQVLQSQEIALVSILYSSFSFFTTFLAAWLLKHYFRYGRPPAKSDSGSLSDQGSMEWH